jgi:hypothetical protein
MNPAFIHRQYIIKNLMVNNDVLILTSGTGLGKTTKVPLYMIELFTKKGLLGEYTILENDPITKKRGLKSNMSQYSDFDKRPEPDPDPKYNGYDYKSKSYSLPYINEDSKVLCAVPKNILAVQNGDNEKKDNEGNIGSYIVRSIKNTDGSVNTKDKPIITYISADYKDKKTFGEALTFITSGYLNKIIINDPYLIKENISCVILDEAHERSIDIDLLLVNLKKILLVRPNFKVVIMSATINTGLFSKYFFNAPVYHVNPIGEQFTNDVFYLTNYCYNHIQAIMVTLNKILDTSSLAEKQHILIFVSGKADKENLCEEMGIDKNSIAPPPFSISNKPYVFQKYKNKNVVYVDKDYEKSKLGFDFTISTIFIATNVIESSVTIDNLKFVIDTGLENTASYDSKIDIYSLNVNAITQPSAEQRKGRVGRKMPGITYRLYTQNFFTNFMKNRTVPEILKSNIEREIINILNTQQNFLNFDFIESPSKDQCLYTMQKLIKYNIIPNTYNIYTTYDDLSDENKRNIKLYNDLSYIKVEKIPKGLSIDNILLHIIIDYYDINKQIDDVFKDLVKIILMLAISEETIIKKPNPEKDATKPDTKPDPKDTKWNPILDDNTNIDNPINKSQIIYMYNLLITERTKYANILTNIEHYYNPFMTKFTTLTSTSDVSFKSGDITNEDIIIAQISKILSIHGHICKVCSVDFTEKDEQKRYYFGSQSIFYDNANEETPYTYVKGNIMKNNINFFPLNLNE